MRCVFPNDLEGCAWHTVCSYGASPRPKTEVAHAARRASLASKCHSGSVSIHAGPLTADRLRAAERATMRHVGESILMDRAADAVAAEAVRVITARRGSADGARVIILAGSGNNGGDALLAGARLRRAGAEVTALLVGDDVHIRGETALIAAGGAIIDAGPQTREAHAVMLHADAVVDGIVGLGARPGLRPPADELVAAIPQAAVVIAVDIPSGLEADSPKAEQAHVHADVTVTFTASKVCLLHLPAAASAGRVLIVDIGVVLEPDGV